MGLGPAEDYDGWKDHGDLSSLPLRLLAYNTHCLRNRQEYC